MDTAKEKMLARVRHALGDVPGTERPEEVTIRRNYELKSNDSDEERLRLFAERVGEYKATVKIISEDRLIPSIFEALGKQQVKRLVAPPGIPGKWIPDNTELLRDEPGRLCTHEELNRSDGVITTCRVAVAQTGTIILDGGSGQGRRALTLLPDYHLCIVRSDQIVGIIPEAFALLDEEMKQTGPPLTFISGPSATSDIELNRVEGVHGPRRLEVLIVVQDA